MAFKFDKAVLNRLQNERRKEGDKPSSSSGPAQPMYQPDATLAVRFCDAAEVNALRLNRFKWDGRQGAAASFDDPQLARRLAATVHFGRALGATRAITLKHPQFSISSERYVVAGGDKGKDILGLPKIHGIPVDTPVLMFFRIDEGHSDEEVANMILTHCYNPG